MPEPSRVTLVLLEDIGNAGHMTEQAKKMGGKLESFDQKEASALFSLPSTVAAHDFMSIARQQGFEATIQYPGQMLGRDILSAIKEDAERVRRSLKKSLARPPWAP